MSNSFQKYHIYFLAILWTINSVIWYQIHGPGLMYDSYQYLKHAENIWTGEWIGERYLWYLSYISFLSIIIKLIPNYLHFIIILQMVLSGIAGAFVLKILKALGVGTAFSFLGTTLFLLWPGIQVWNSFILTESTFISLSIILFYTILTGQTKWMIILLLIILFQRPTGTIVFISTALALFINTKFVHRKIKITLILITLIAGIYTLNIILSNYDLIEEYNQGKIVYSADKIDNEALKKTLIIESDQKINPVQKTEFPLLDSFKFLINNPVFTIKLVGSRVLFYSFDYRPYYSSLHNVVNVILIMISYILSAFYLLQSNNAKVKTWIILFFLGCTAMAGLACITWEGRLFAPIYPFFFIFAVAGLELFIKEQIRK